MICRHCGGSGIQRVADQRFRTCLSCLGQGRLISVDQGMDLERVRQEEDSPARSQ